MIINVISILKQFNYPLADYTGIWQTQLAGLNVTKGLYDVIVGMIEGIVGVVYHPLQFIENIGNLYIKSDIDILTNNYINEFSKIFQNSYNDFDKQDPYSKTGDVTEIVGNIASFFIPGTAAVKGVKAGSTAAKTAEAFNDVDKIAGAAKTLNGASKVTKEVEGVNGANKAFDATREITETEKAVGEIEKAGETAGDVGKGERVAGETAGEAEKIIDGFKIIGGKIDGKIPLEDYKRIRKISIKNPNSDTMTLGKYVPTRNADGTLDWTKPAPDCYIPKAGKTSYFDLGDEYGEIQAKYHLTNDDIFNLFNKTAIDDVLKANPNEVFRFSQDPKNIKQVILRKSGII